MKLGALIVTTGLPSVSGVAALLSEVGAISAGQRMISAFQCAGVSLVGLVVGPEDKKSERQLAQNGVVFLRCREDTGFFQGLQQGLSFMRGKFDRVFVVPGDVPLFLPSTLQAMLQSPASLVVPETRHVNGYPLLLDDRAMEFLLAQPDYAVAEKAVRQGALPLDRNRCTQLRPVQHFRPVSPDRDSGLLQLRRQFWLPSEEGRLRCADSERKMPGT